MFIGEELRQAREQMGASLKDVEDATKIRAKYIKAMENDNFDVLPGKAYAKGFLRTYARFLSLDGETLARRYEEQLSPQVAAQDVVGFAQMPVARYGKPAVWWKGIAVAVLTLLVFALLYQGGNRLGNLSDDSEQQPRTSSQYSIVDEHQGQAPEIAQETKKINMVLQVISGESWIQVAVDDKYVFQGTLGPNHVKEFAGQKNIWVKLGNAGTVNVKVNGRDYGFLGSSGQVITRTFTIEDAQQTAGG